MKGIKLRFKLVMIVGILFVNNIAWSNDLPKNLFMINTTNKSMSDVVTAVKDFANVKKWVYLGDFKVKKGKVILIKFCVKAAGKKAWKAGLHVSALLPCGNMGVYQRDGKTEISLLNPNYMTTLYPNENLKQAVNLLLPLYKEMMITIVK